MKYGIKHDNGAIEAVTQFPDNELQPGFDEISKRNYDDFVATLQSNFFVTYDSTNKKLVIDESAGDQLAAHNVKLAQRGKLRKLSIELGLATRLSETTKGLQNEFDNLATDYQGGASGA